MATRASSTPLLAAVVEHGAVAARLMVGDVEREERTHEQRATAPLCAEVLARAGSAESLHARRMPVALGRC